MQKITSLQSTAKILTRKARPKRFLQSTQFSLTTKCSHTTFHLSRSKKLNKKSKKPRLHLETEKYSRGKSIRGVKEFDFNTHDQGFHPPVPIRIVIGTESSSNEFIIYTLYTANAEPILALCRRNNLKNPCRYFHPSPTLRRFFCPTYPLFD